MSKVLAVMIAGLFAAGAFAQTKPSEVDPTAQGKPAAKAEAKVQARPAGQVKAADYFIEPNIVSANSNSGGNNVGGLVGGLFGGVAGAIAGGISVKKGEANVTLSVVNARTTVEEALTEGYSRKSDLSWGGGGGVFTGGFLGAAGAGAAGMLRAAIPRWGFPANMQRFCSWQ